MTPTRGLLGAIASCALVLLCACGSSNTATASPTTRSTSTPSASAIFPSNTPTVAPTAVPSGAMFTVQTSLTGTDVVSGSFDVAVGSCVAPSALGGTVGGHHVALRINAVVSQPGQSQGLSPGDITVTFDADTWQPGSAANSPKPSTGSLEVNSDASGNTSFQNLFLSSASGSQSLESGDFTWICR